ncbi:MAG: potassium transporter Kef, partial [Phenylobacterium sp.]|nr:potassium transporter Kef [Phenylobacterium sp.]
SSFTIAASLAQIGEFSFILAGVGVSVGIMARDTHDLVLAGALISILANPFVFRLADRLGRSKDQGPPADDAAGTPIPAPP